ncbi:GGDEF domain-containing protein [Isoptericola sp. b441]|uniref:GGDEF domain-containing protein n=1 Tax=Actinotalea lenta TaxID=3064654 RepID=A0ABT9D709_9CELL|nr:GGDEF domain-containing protein [Isoptericola sp. b441]MDO8105833.1 GGDEF domain-containing protein [Isoptericola sp. b441]
MTSRSDRVAGRRHDDLAALARRVVALGIAVCVPVMAAMWLTEAPHDPWVRWGYPPLVTFLAVFAWILVRHPRLAGYAAVISLVGLEGWWVLLAVARVGDAQDAASAWVSLWPTPLLDAAVCVVVGFLFQRTITAVVHGAAYATVMTAAVAVALWRRPDGGAYVWLAARYGVYLGVFLALLLVLSRAKERVASAVDRADRAVRHAARMQDMAYLDELTGIANRRRLIEELGHQAALAGPDNPIGVVFLDLDHFKQVNDTLGHDVGDRALRIVADVASRLVRDGDLVARLGGEEFVVVAPGADARQTARLAERLRQTVPVELGVAVGTPVTASFGVTALRPGESPDAVLRRVDALMYRAKSAGRDTVRPEEPDAGR